MPPQLYQQLQLQYWYQLRPSVPQWNLWNCPARFKTVVAGRGSGKSLLAKRNVVISARRLAGLYFYTLPTFAQAKNVAWDDLKNLSRTLGGSYSSEVSDINETSLTIRFINGSELRLMGVDKPARAEGVQYRGGVMDEMSDTMPGVFENTFLPALSEHLGWTWLIGIPKIAGVGGPEYKRKCDEWHTAKLEGSKEYAHHYWKASEVVDEKHLALSRQSMSPEEYDEQYNASWLNLGGGIFHYWDDRIHKVNMAYQYTGGLIVVGCDFNVDPMCWVIGVVEGAGRERILRIFDELFVRNTTTQGALQILINKLQRHGVPTNNAKDVELLGSPYAGRVAFFGDAASRARHTNTVITDYFAIKVHKQFQGCAINFPKRNPAVSDRIATTNFAMTNDLGDSHLLVHHNCERLIWDIKNRVYESGTRKPLDTHKDAGHMTDALGYLIWHVLPLSTAIKEDVRARQPSVSNAAIKSFLSTAK